MTMTEDEKAKFKKDMQEIPKLYHKQQDNIIVGISKGTINNIRLVDWSEATHGYSFRDLEYILERLPGEQAKNSVLKAAFSEWEHKKDDILDKLDKELERYQNDLLRYSITKVRIKLIKDFGYECKIRIPENEPPAENEPFIIDERLTTDKARDMFRKFAEKGYIEIVEGGHYKWLITTRNRKALFGYWLEQAASHCGVYESNGKISRKPFEDLFNIHGTARNTDQTPQPKGYKNIDNIFKTL